MIIHDNNTNENNDANAKNDSNKNMVMKNWLVMVSSGCEWLLVVNTC